MMPGVRTGAGSLVNPEMAQLHYAYMHHNASYQLRSGSLRPFLSMKTSWRSNAFRITGPLWWESTGHHKGPVSLCFLYCWQEQASVPVVESPVIWRTVVLIWRHCNIVPKHYWCWKNCKPVRQYDSVVFTYTSTKAAMSLKPMNLELGLSTLFTMVLVGWWVRD